MKLLELRFKNLNSLYGEWVIDFTDPEYVSNAIFALTGPTGAGKSTILDAICLALYGATPRLGKITRSSNQIMSRQTGECYAEVLFESQAGRYRCHWEQRRARKKADGNLQDQEHQIADGSTGKPIETKKSLVSGVIEAKTGMDFDRFTRSILLAQGGFDTFLKADTEQKSKILEQITGTEIYSAISRRVHERLREQQETLRLLNAETAAIALLDPEQERQIQRELAGKQKEESELIARLAETERAISWLRGIHELKIEIGRLDEEAVNLQSEEKTFAPERQQLDRSLRAALLEGPYAALTEIRKQQADDQARLNTAAAELPGLESAAGAQADSLRAAQLQTVTARGELKSAEPLIRKIRSLDQKIGDLQKAVREEEQRRTKAAAQIDGDQKLLCLEQQKKSEAETNLDRAEDFLSTHARDAWLIGGLAGVEEQLGSLLSKQKEITRHEGVCNRARLAVSEAAQKLDQSRLQCAIRKRELEGAIQQLQHGNKSLSELLGGRLLREYRTEKDGLLRELAMLARIAELEDHRASLEDGKPCPLCGSLDHPFAEGNAPVADDAERKIGALTTLIDRAEDLEAANRKFEEAEAGARKNFADAETAEKSADFDKQAAAKHLAESQADLEQARTAYSIQKRAVLDKLEPLGIADIADDQVPVLLAVLKARLADWQAQVAARAEIDKTLTAINSEINKLEALIASQGNVLTESMTRLKSLKKEHEAACSERKALYSDKHPDAEENRLSMAVADAEEAEKQAAARNSELQQRLTAQRTHVDTLKQRIDQRETELKHALEAFLTALTAAGFADEQQFLAARLTEERRAALSARAKELHDAQTDLKARQNDRATRLASEIARQVSDKPLAELESQAQDYGDMLKRRRGDIAALLHRLGENAAARDRVRDRRTAVETHKITCGRWERLHALIGSADGKKYRTFAQGLTFELMVSHANRQLEKMTDRYLLIRDHAEPLELNVVDNYQAGEIRSTRNLSGGESFIVSLALALGLSRMASRKVRVDSLFLDEGFGTLDEDALETALETLSELRQDNKLIGVISHIPALKERIGTQIAVTPESGGRSRLTGPGCALVSG